MMMKRHILITLPMLLLFGLISGCTPVVVKTQDNAIKKDTYTFTSVKLPAEPKRPFPTVNVDYDNHNRMIFFDFNTGIQKTVDSDAWDIAIVVGDTPDNIPTGSTASAPKAIYAVTNSGDYGEHARLLPFKAGKTSADYAGQLLNKIQQASFKYGEQELSPFQNDPDTDAPVANPFYTALETGKHYLLRTGKTDDTAKVYEIWFDGITPAVGASFTLHVKPAELSQAESSETKPKTVTGFRAEYTLTGNINGDYSFNYIKLGTDSARILDKDHDGIPQKNEWQLLFIRTNVYAKEMGELLGTDGIVSTSSILTNSPAGVETAALYGWDFPEVTAIPDSTYFAKQIDGVGKGFANSLNDNPEKRRKAWYYGLSMPPTFYLSRITYIFKWETASQTHYAKFRPGTFYGSNGEKFCVTFRYAVTP